MNEKELLRGMEDMKNNINQKKDFKLTEQQLKQTILFENEEWQIVVKCTQKGNLCTCVYYRGMHMGFVNIGDFKTQQMFYNLNFPFMIELAKELKNERVK